MKTKKAEHVGIPMDFLACLFLCFITLLVYWQVKDHEFISYDDDTYVTENRHVQKGITLDSIAWSFTTVHGANWHPLTWLSHMLDIQLFGTKAGHHHLANVFFHLANTFLLFLVLRKMTNGLWQSAFVAALFAFHPLHVESVAWVAERKDVLSTFFWFMTIWSYIRYVKSPGVPRYALFIFLYMFGLMAKPMMVTLPFVLFLLDYWPLKRLQAGLSGIKPLVLEKTPLFFLSAASCVITYFAQQKGGAVEPFCVHPFTVRVANALVSYTAYMGKMIWPSHPAILYPYPQGLILWQVAGAGMVLALMSYVVIRGARRHPYLVVGWLWYLGTLVPVIGLIQVGLQSMADRYTYVPLIGLFIIIAWGVPELLSHWRYRNIGLSMMGALVLSILSVITYQQLPYWRNSISLYEQALRVTTGNYMIHTNLGVILAGQGQLDEAVSHYSDALKINPHFAMADYNLGLALLKQDRINDAMGHFSNALVSKPDYADVHNNLGFALSRQGKTDGAVSHFLEALKIEPDHEIAHYNLGNILATQGRIAEAIRHYSKALTASPDYEEALNNLAWIYATHKNPEFRNGEKAVKLAEHVCNISGYSNPSLLDTLAAAYAEAGRFEKACSIAEKAISLSESAGPKKMVGDFRMRLELYRSGHSVKDKK